MQFKFEGGKALEAALSEFSRVAAKNIARRALKRAAKPIADAWESAVKVRTGRYRKSVAVGTNLNRRQSGLNKKLGKSEVEIHIGTNDPAGIQEEFGGRQAAHPAARPAWAAEGGQAAVDRIIAELKPEIDKAAARAARKAAKGK